MTDVEKLSTENLRAVKDNHVEADCRKKKRDNGEYKSQFYKENKNENVKCFRCDKPGHYSKNCPKNKGKHFQDRQNEANENEINNIFVGMVMHDWNRKTYGKGGGIMQSLKILLYIS